MKKAPIILTSMSLWLSSQLVAAYQGDGTVQFAHGDVYWGNTPSELHKVTAPSAINLDQAIATNNNSGAHLLLDDGTQIFIKPNTSIKLNTTQDDQRRHSISLYYGGVRIDQTAKTAHPMRLATPVNIIAATDSDIEVSYLPDGLKDHKAGTYLHVSSGRAALENKAGSKRVNANQTAFTQSSKSSHNILKQLPLFFVSNQALNTLDISARSETSTFVSPPKPKEQDASKEPTTEDLSPSDTIYVLNDPLTEVKDRAPDFNALNTSATQLGEQNGYFISDGGVINLSDATLWQAESELKALSTDEGYHWVSSAVSGTEKTLLRGNIRYGSWSNGWSLVTPQSQTDYTSPTQYVYTDEYTEFSGREQSEQILSYNAEGLAFDSNGNQGTTSGQLAIDFSNSSIDLLLSSTIDSTNWEAEGKGSLDNFKSDGLTLSGSQITSGVAQSANGTVVGQFAGDNGEALFGHFNLTSTNDSLQGVYGSTIATEHSTLSFANGYGVGLSAAPVSLGDYKLWGDDSVKIISADSTYFTNLSFDGEQSQSTFEDATITMGLWNSWHSELINSTSSSSPIAYIYSDQHDLSGLQSKSDTNNFSLQNGYTFSSLDSSDSLINSAFFSMNFTNQNVQLTLSADSGGYQWEVSGSGTLDQFTEGSLALSGTRTKLDDIANTESISGVFGGNPTDSGVNGLYGYYNLTSSSDSLNGVLVAANEGYTLTGIRAYEFYGKDIASLTALQVVNLLDPSSSTSTLSSIESTSELSTSDYYVDSAGENTFTGYHSTNEDAWATIDHDSEFTQVDLDEATYTLSSSSVALDGTHTSYPGINTIRNIETGMAEGNVFWGRVSNNSTDQSLSVRSNKLIENSTLAQLHYIHTDTLTPESQVLNKVGTAEYQFAGGTKPSRVNLDGSVSTGSLNYFNVSVDFNSQTLSAIMGLAIDDSEIVASTPGSQISNFLSEQGTSLIVDDGVSNTLGGSLKGKFVGSDAQGMINTFNLNSTKGDISGAAFLQQTN